MSESILIEIMFGLILISLAMIIHLSTRKKKAKEPTGDGPDPVNPHELLNYRGFTDTSTKDAINIINGVDKILFTKPQGVDYWIVEIRDDGIIWKTKAHSMMDIGKFCLKHGKPLVRNESP